MGRNVEIKAKVNNMDRQRGLLEGLADAQPQIVYQEDTFFNCLAGRLKLRTTPDGKDELIHYQREDRDEPTESEYVLSLTNDPDTLKEALSNALGVRAVVRKNRRVYVVERTRIHLDEVEGLGDFIELEVELRPGESQETGIEVAQDLMEKLEIRGEDLVKSAYVDLLESAPGSHSPERKPGRQHENE